MTRIDIAWESGFSVRESVWGWRRDIKVQIVNPDIDGLLTACLLSHLKGWPVIGFYDTQRLMLDSTWPVPLDMPEVAWVDIDMCWPGARSLSQHVILDSPSDVDHVSAYAETVNPSLLRGHARQNRYATKYPFGTFQWAWWLAGKSALPAPPDPMDELMSGLAWMPDGGFQSVEPGRFRSNCLEWAIQQMPGSILSPLAQRDPDRARSAVTTAERFLRRRSGVDRGWRNHQFNLTSPSSTGPRMNFRVDEAPGVLQALCDAICAAYRWTAPRLPQKLNIYSGIWRSGPVPPPRWPNCANHGEVVSLAVTGANRFCWTEPGDLGVALGQ